MTVETPQSKKNPSNQGSPKAAVQPGTRLTGKLKSPSCILLTITVAVVLVPRLLSGEVLRDETGQSAAASPSAPSSEQNDSNAAGKVEGADILSDTRGVNFSPYIKNILHPIWVQYVKFLPEKARKPTYASGETIIRLTINPDGKLVAMHLDASTHDEALDRAAWAAIRSQTFPALPATFTGPNLDIRIHFSVNLPGNKPHASTNRECFQEPHSPPR